MLRQLLVLVHRYIGLTTALFLIVAGLTGSIMAFENEIDAWLNPELFHTTSQGAALSPTQLAADVEAQLPHTQVTYLPVAFERGESVLLSVRAKSDPVTGLSYALGFNQVFVDPVTGKVLGTRQTGTAKFDKQHFIPFIVKLHYSLHLPGSWGLWLLGSVALLWIGDCLVALWLTFPRGRPFIEKWKPAWQIKRKRLNFDLHRAGGLWLWIVLLMLAISSVSLNLYSEVFKPVVNAISPITPTPFDQLRARSLSAPPAFNYDRALALARVEGSVRGIDAPVGALGYRPERGFYFAIYRKAQRTSDAGLGNARIYLDDQNGRVIGVHVPGEGTAGDVFMQIQYPLHSGQIAGLAGRAFICVTGLLIAMLSVTGLVIWLRKRRARAASRAREPASRNVPTSAAGVGRVC